LGVPTKRGSDGTISNRKTKKRRTQLKRCPSAGTGGGSEGRILASQP